MKKIEKVTVKESINGLEFRLELIDYDNSQYCNFGYGGE